MLVLHEERHVGGVAGGGEEEEDEGKANHKGCPGWDALMAWMSLRQMNRGCARLARN